MANPCSNDNGIIHTCNSEQFPTHVCVQRKWLAMRVQQQQKYIAVAVAVAVAVAASIAAAVAAVAVAVAVRVAVAQFQLRHCPVRLCVLPKFCKLLLCAFGLQNCRRFRSFANLPVSNPSKLPTVAQFYNFSVPWPASNPLQGSTVAQLLQLLHLFVCLQPFKIATVAQLYYCCTSSPVSSPSNDNGKWHSCGPLSPFFF